ncbi:cation:proton antiporter [Streptomyces sp. CL7]|uniref:cation:proton antiporter domain-containing protein n=1 Tax=Streptomyces sp. CL7 TaxID=3096006 RepID=UPI002A74D2ED|nr:cation:proton antiporter [Streptomyces sp. CL7]WPP34289.1 cation:proton antiporter [Streptomyces sp. CL7]
MTLLQYLFLDLVVILAAARFLGAAAVRLGQPRVIGEIAAGLLLGPTVLGHLAGDAVFPTEAIPGLKILAAIGLTLFMFVVGMELDHRVMRGRARVVTGLAAGSTLLPLALGCAFALHLAPAYAHGDTLPFTLFVGVAVSATAFPVLARILADRGLQQTLIGGIALSAAAVIDIVAYTLLSVTVALDSASGNEAWRLLLVPLYVAVLLTAVRPLLRRATTAAEPLPWLFVGLFASALVAEWLQIHYIFGAFAFGVVMPRDKAFLHRLRQRLEPAVLLLLPVFFAVTGLTVDLTALRLDEIGVLGVIMAISVLGKVAGGYGSARMFGIPHRDSATLGALVNTRGLTELVILSVGLEQGLIDVDLYAMLLVMALATTAMTGPLLTLFTPTPAPPPTKPPVATGAADGRRRVVPPPR